MSKSQRPTSTDPSVKTALIPGSGNSSGIMLLFRFSHSFIHHSSAFVSASHEHSHSREGCVLPHYFVQARLPLKLTTASIPIIPLSRQQIFFLNVFKLEQLRAIRHQHTNASFLIFFFSCLHIHVVPKTALCI